MNRHLEELIELSKLDKAIDDFTPLIEVAKKKLNRKRRKRDEIAKKIEVLNGVIEEANSNIISFEEQIKALNEQLTLATAKEREVKSEREQKALQTETELAKDKIRVANEEIEKGYTILESKTEELGRLKRELESADVEFEKMSKEVMKKVDSIEEEKAKLFAKREQKTMAIDQKILSFYEKIRIWAKNSAVVPVKKQACYGCYMKLNDSAYAEVIKSEDICTCHHCGRILYLEPQTVDVE